MSFFIAPLGDQPQFPSFDVPSEGNMPGPSSLPVIAREVAALLIEKFVDDYDSMKIERTLATQVVYSVFKDSGIGAFNNNSVASFKFISDFLGESSFVFVHPMVCQINILYYLSTVNMIAEYLDYNFHDSFDMNTCGEHFKWSFKTASNSFWIKRFNSDLVGVFDGNTSFSSLQQAPSNSDDVA